LDLANTGEILVQFGAIPRAQAGLQAAGVLLHDIEDALLVAQAALTTLRRLVRVAVAEQPLEDRARVYLMGHRHRLRAPGDIGGVGAAIAAVTVARLRAAFAAEF